MNPLLEQFLSEARDGLQDIGEKLMQLENAPADAGLMNELFRLVHTLKGNSGLFDFPEMTRVLHAGEDLMDAVRNGQAAYSRKLADRLLDAMDFIGMLCDEIEADGVTGAAHASVSVHLVKGLRQLMARDEVAGIAERHLAAGITDDTSAIPAAETAASLAASLAADLPLATIPEPARLEAYRRASAGEPLHWLLYTPSEQCFYQGDDPFFLARQTPELLWGGIEARTPWPPLADLDAYCCVLDIHLLSAAPRILLEEQYRYVADQMTLTPVSRFALVLPQGDANGGPVYDDFVSDARNLLAAGDLAGLARNAGTMLELSSPDLWIASALRWLRLVLETEPENRVVLDALVDSLSSLNAPDWTAVLAGWVEPRATHPADPPPGHDHRPLTAAPIESIHEDRPRVDESQVSGDDGVRSVLPILTTAEAEALAAILASQREILALTDTPTWLPGRLKAAAAVLSACLRVSGATDARPALERATATALAENTGAALLAWLDGQFSSSTSSDTRAKEEASTAPVAIAADPPQPWPQPEAESEVKFGRRAEDAIAGPKSLKVDQAKIDRLMNLIGEMVVAKNALPYLAGRAETVFGVRELSRDIKGHHAVINRIAEEMQDAIMQVRMMPVSFVFQRFPRLVRDISRKLGKEVNLVLEGEDTEADKNIIEALGDPLMHIVRNSLDHGIESPEIRRAAGKPAAGTLLLRAAQESDRVVIQIRDDGKGIDPETIKRKAYAKGLIDEATLERISDQEAVNLVFAAGFSTAEQVSDLSGRGVGMDVVRTAVEKVNGTVALTSERGRGTHLSLSVPLSMAVTNVMIVVSDGQLFGVPMDSVVETVRVPRAAIRTIKRSLATVLRGRIVPLKSINALLGLAAPPRSNADDELAVLVVRLGDESVGLLVDDFRETLDIILKPMTGVLSGIPAYAGSALMGDGSVLMVLNVREIL
ncbi:chemotaxis protein CheA [Thiocystis violacea]|uniref:chemotaxis protein CheA n=1 Tax=Thiocystis violacea TaxID=13725 RepID=UPI0019038F08|nr:chemotaxis protein CheA [Thiocystis violacea]MBK1719071.1 chemotaxis protein CheA [Thiocystis violacea]